ncbi:uncharacterized protein LOC120352946 [Nilaparvata lugens]|uniref:uncharacterized protein LOC120352946 n=1 Tax=Nilaparvata lugens TaxID=108931 RepID=UPI00193E0E69|nr:uncharacterized protein LOC120352946 [Nilaparvata lugens]
MKKYYQIILVWLTALSLNVEAGSIFDVGPYKVDQKQIGIDYCPISSKRCMSGKHHRRRIAGTSDWLWNGTLSVIDVYIKNTTTTGIYDAKDFFLQPQKHFQLAGVPVLPYGSYKIEFRINNDIRINCFCGVLFIDLVPDIDAIRNRTIQHNQFLNKFNISFLNI